ncbi:MAG: hypothetical protein JNN25_16385 [Candidatus Kapabacteria bacterium]|nr:hypothetical protein [Candidatus Kapabacteria bacterium]
MLGRRFRLLRGRPFSQPTELPRGSGSAADEPTANKIAEIELPDPSGALWAHRLSAIRSGAGDCTCGQETDASRQFPSGLFTFGSLRGEGLRRHLGAFLLRDFDSGFDAATRIEGFPESLGQLIQSVLNA